MSNIKLFLRHLDTLFTDQNFLSIFVCLDRLHKFKFIEGEYAISVRVAALNFIPFLLIIYPLIVHCMLLDSRFPFPTLMDCPFNLPISYSTMPIACGVMCTLAAVSQPYTWVIEQLHSIRECQVIHSNFLQFYSFDNLLMFCISSSTKN